MCVSATAEKVSASSTDGIPLHDHFYAAKTPPAGRIWVRKGLVSEHIRWVHVDRPALFHQPRLPFARMDTHDSTTTRCLLATGNIHACKSCPVKAVNSMRSNCKTISRPLVTLSFFRSSSLHTEIVSYTVLHSAHLPLRFQVNFTLVPTLKTITPLTSCQSFSHSLPIPCTTTVVTP